MLDGHVIAMTLISFENGMPVMRGGAIGTGGGCCCGSVWCCCDKDGNIAPSYSESECVACAGAIECSLYDPLTNLIAGPVTVTSCLVCDEAQFDAGDKSSGRWYTLCSDSRTGPCGQVLYGSANCTDQECDPACDTEYALSRCINGTCVEPTVSVSACGMTINLGGANPSSDVVFESGSWSCEPPDPEVAAGLPGGVATFGTRFLSASAYWIKQCGHCDVLVVDICVGCYTIPSRCFRAYRSVCDGSETINQVDSDTFPCGSFVCCEDVPSVTINFAP